MKPISTGTFEKRHWLVYDSKVLLIKPDINGNDADFQIDGTNCRQQSVTGFVIGEFEADYRWFKPDWWYKMVRWYEDDKQRSNVLLYLSRKYQRIITKTIQEDFEQSKDLTTNELLENWNFNCLDSLIEELKPKAIPVEKILSRMLDYASKEMKIKLYPDFEDYTYGEHWFESYIPVRTANDETYILTWMNCD